MDKRVGVGVNNDGGGGGGGFIINFSNWKQLVSSEDRIKFWKIVLHTYIVVDVKMVREKIFRLHNHNNNHNKSNGTRPAGWLDEWLNDWL